MASNTGRVAVRIPVEAEISNVSKTIEELKRALENVKPETKGYKQIESLLDGAEKKILQIQKATASGLIDKASLRTLEKNFEDVFSSVEVAAKRLGNVNYENLKIPDSVVQSIKDLEQQMDAAKKAYTKLEGTKLAEVAASSKELGESLNAIGVNFDTDNIDASLDKTEKKITAVREKIDELNESTQKNQLVAQNNRNKSAELQKIKDIFKEGNQGKKARAARTEFFDKNGNFKAGGKDAIEAYLRNFQLDENFIEQVKKLSGSRLSELEEVANNIINKKQKSVDSRATKAQNEADLSGQMAAIQTADLQKLQALRTTLADLKVDPEVQSGFEAMTQELESLRAEVERLKGSAVEASGVGKAAGEAVEGVGNAASSVQDKLAGASSELERMTNIGNTVSNMKNAIAQWMGFYQVVNLVKSAVRNIVSDIRELDKVMTEIAIVTNMTQKDLWAQMNTYQSIAREYGVSTKGVYEVSQLFYQQGLDSVSVMKLTTETLKMAKIAGLDYSTATDYMTVAIRGFHLEMDQAQNVVDVYSNIASKSASSTTELAEAMSKTASSAAAVGSSFENTTAMIAMMVETTRESASNIGSAMKSIISRYGEMKASPAKLVDSEGEELDFNKVDTALKSVGISMHTAAGQFRDFDDVILDLSKKWQTLDVNTQRYIATVMAGNRQQSRFLALVSDYDRLSELVEEAANSQDAGTLQTLKTMDSLETKIQNVQTAWQGFYANLGLENIFKGVLDGITSLLNRLNSMPKVFGKIPVLAIALVAKLVSVIKSLGNLFVSQMAKTWQQISEIIKNNIKKGGQEGGQEAANEVNKAMNNVPNTNNTASNVKAQQTGIRGWISNHKLGVNYAGMAMNVIGTGIQTAGIAMDGSDATAKGLSQLGGGLVSGVGSALSTFAMSGNIVVSVLSGVASAASGVIGGIHDLIHASELELEAAKKNEKQKKQEELIARNEADQLSKTISKLKELEDARYESNEAYQEWLDYKIQIVETYPELLSYYDAEGQAVIDLKSSYALLAKERREAAKAAYEAAESTLTTLKSEQENAKSKGYETTDGYTIGFLVGENGQERLKDHSDTFDPEIAQSQRIDYTVESLKRLLDVEWDNNSQIYAYLNRQLGLSTRAASIKEIAPNWFAQNIGTEERYQQLSGREQLQKYIAWLDFVNGDNGYSASINEQEIKVGLEKINKELSEYIEMQIGSADRTLEEISRMSDASGDALFIKVAKSSLKPDSTDDNRKELLNWYLGIDEDIWKQAKAIIANTQNYRNINEVRAAIEELGIEEIDTYLNEAIIENFNNQNKKAVTAFRAAIDSSLDDNNGEVATSARLLRGIADDDELMHISGEISAQYLNSIQSQWYNLVNNASSQYDRSKNAEFLANIYTQTSQLELTASNAVAGILTSAELTTREGLEAAIEALKQYAKNTGINLDGTINELEKQRDSLVANLNTELQSYSAALNTATKNVASIYKRQNSGFDDLETMQQELTKMNAGRDTKLDFNSAFVFDKTLNAYVYTTEGLMAAIDAQQREADAKFGELISDQEKKNTALTNIYNIINNLGETSSQRTVAELNKIANTNFDSESREAAKRILEIMATGKDFISAYRIYYREIEDAGDNAKQLQKAAEQLNNESQQIANLNAIDFASVIKGDRSTKIVHAIRTWYNSLLTTTEGLNIIEQIAGAKPENIEGMSKQDVEQAFNEFEEGFYSALTGDVSTGLSTLKGLLDTGFDYDTAVSWYNAKLKASYDLLSSAVEKAPQEIIQLTEEQARILKEAQITISDNEGIKTITVQALINSADRLWDAIDAGFQAGIISLDSYINAYKNNHTSLKLKNTRSIISNLNSYSIGTNITDLEIGKKLETLGYNLKEVRDAADNLIGYYIIDIPNNLREAYNQLYEDIVANGGTQSEQNDAWAKMMTANSASNTLDLISSAQKLTYEKFAEAANNAGKDAAELYQRYLNEGIIRIVNGQIQVVKINEFLEGMNIDPTSAEYKQAVDEFNQTMASNYATLIKTNNRAVINAINAIGKTSLTIDDFAQLFGSEEEMAEVFNEQGDIINRRWQKVIKRVGPDTYDIVDFDGYIELVNKGLQQAGQAIIQKNSQAYLNAYKNWVSGQNTKYDFSGFEIFLADFKEVTYTQLVEYAKSIGKTIEQVESASTFNASTGTYDITNVIKAEGLASMMEMPLNLVRAMVKDGDAIADNIENYVAQLSPEMAEKVSKYASEALRKLFDRASKDIQKDLEALGKGTKKFATLSELKDYNKTLKFFKLDNSDYVWDEVARNYVLTAEGLQKSIRNYSNELWLSVYAETGDIEKANAEVARQLNATVSSAAENINISQYISSDRMKSDVKTITDAYNQFVAIVEEMGEQISLTSEEFVQILNEGGESAVRVAEILAKASGKELSYKNLTDTYRAEIVALEDGIAQIEYGIGAIINERAYDILTAAGYEFERIGNGKIAVITKIGNIEEAYDGFITRMAEVPGATLAQLNEQTVAAIQGSNVNRIASIASNAANQSLESFGNTLAQRGIQLAEVWEDWTKRGIISYDGSNVHVLDLQAYFKELGIEITDQIMSNPAYVAGLNAYNEAFLELNRATETRIVEEVKKVSQASAGDKVNLTYFSSVLDKLTKEQQDALTQALKDSGAILQDGMLYISDNADTLGISVAIGRAANQTGLLLASEIAQVGYSVDEALKTYIQLLNNGIQGTLSNEDANTLRQYAESLGIELDFTRTEEGLKLSVNSATQLVAKLREVDAYAAKTSFKVLKDSIKASNDGCQTLEETLRTIVELEAQMNKNPGNDAVRERLELYRQIRDEQMDDPNSYNFMSRALPNGMQGAENYWNSWGTAFKAMNEAATTGYIGIQDFYNIVNEMNYIAGESGQTIDFMGYSLNGELINMASLIQEGMSAIKNVDGEGAKIDLSGFSTSLLAGAEGMEDGVEEGIKAFARAQIKMLDAAIQMLEGIVALQELGEIDTDKSGIIDFGELFTGTEDDVTGFQELAINKANEVKAAADANEQLRQVLEQFRIGELNLYQIMGYIANNDYAALDEAGLNSTTLLSFLNAIKNINFSDSDLSTISETLSTALTNAFQGAEVTLGEDGSITVVIGAKDIQTEVTEGAQAAVAEEAQAAVAGKVNFKGLFGNASKSIFTPQINDPKSDLTGKEDKVNEFGVQVDGVTLEPSDGFTIDADAILRILEEFVGKALVPTDEQGNKEGGWTLLGVISDFLFEIINGLQERIQGNIDKKARPVIDEAVQEENKNLNVDLKGKVSNLELDGPGSTTKSKDFDTKKQAQLELFKTQYLSNIPLNGSGDVSIDCVYHLNDTGDGITITDAAGNEIAQIPVSILNDFIGLGELSAGDCKIEYDSETGDLTLIIGNGKNSSISIPLNDYVTFNGTGNLSQGDISVNYTGSKDLKGLELKNAPTSVDANLPSETSVTAEGDASTVNIGLAEGYTAGLTTATIPLTTTITTASGDTYTLTINPLNSQLNNDNVDVGNVATVTGSTNTATITTDTNADITLKKPNGEEQKAVVKGSVLIQSLADGSILQEDAQKPGTYSLPDFTVYGEVEITPESIAKAQAQLQLIELQQNLVEARWSQQHYYGLKQGAINNNTTDENAEEQYNYWSEAVNSLQEEIRQVEQIANGAYISSRTQGSTAPHTFSDTYRSGNNNNNNNNNNNTPSSTDINTPQTTLSTNSLAVKVNEGGSTSVDTSEEPLSVTAGRVIFDLASALSNSSSIAESGSAVASAAKSLLGLYFSKDENKIDAIVGVGKIVVSMAGGSPETVTKVGNLARGAASLATEASKGYAAAYESAAAAGATIKVAPTLGKLVMGVLGNLAPYLLGAAAVAAVAIGVIKFVEAKNRQLNFEFEPGAVFDENGDIHVEGKKLIYSLTGIDFEGRDKTEKSVAQQILDILNTAGQGKTSILDLPPEIQEYVNNKKNNPNYKVNEEYEHEIAYYDNLRQSLEDGIVTLTDLENVMMLFYKRRDDLSQYWENRVGKQLGSTAVGATFWNFFPNLFGTLTGGENSFSNLSNFETWQYLYARMQRSKNDVDENNPFDVLLSGLSDTWDQLYTDIADQLAQYISSDATSFDFANFLMKTGITPETLANMVEYRNLRTGFTEGATVTSYEGMARDTSEMQGYVLLYLNIIKRILADAGQVDYDINVPQNVEEARKQAAKALATMRGAVVTAEQAAEQAENSKQETEENTEWTQEDVARLEAAVQLAQTVLDNLTSKTDEATVAQTNLQNIITEAQTAIDRYEALGEGSDFASKMEQVTTAIAEATGEKELTVTGDINALKTLIEDYLADPKTTNVNLNPITASIENYLNNTPHQTKVTLIASQLVGLREVINNALAGIGNVTVGVSSETEGEATGNVALAGGRGTLMGELGPELYVTNGHYYVAGQNGAEFVNLPDDAIVFNHLQTQRLLENGHAGRGRVVTNERKATSLATGNISGPAMASAAAVLAQLKQIRALWDAMLKAPLSDFGSKAGTGKKGGGGGGSKNKDKTDNNSANLDSGYIKDLERWYNLLRKIEKLEQDISYEEKLRSKLQADSVSNGKLIYESYRRSYEALQKEVDNRVKLAELKKGYYEQQMEELKNSKWADFFYFDDEGTIQRKTSGSEFLANLYATNANGGAIHSAREQYQMLLNAGYGSLMEYKEDGSKIEWTDSSGKAREDAYAEAVKAFSSKIDSQTEAYESLREDYMNEMEAILDAQTKQNEILTAIRENTVAVEQEVLDAILSAREREIEELQNQRDALQDSSDKFINGLTDELNKERDMYNQQQEDKELAQLYRQLGILQRSGASASQIRSIQDQISQKEQDAYFEGQQKQIDAIKEASDLQLERLDAQISLMSETLEYQKAHGLLWDQVYQVMSLSESEIAAFITGNNDTWWANSAEKTRLDMVELGNKIQQWTAYRDDISDTKNAITNAINNGIAAITSVVARVSTPNVYTATGDGGYIPSTGTSSDGTTGSSGGGTGSTSGKTGGSSGKKPVNTLDLSTKDNPPLISKNHGYSFTYHGQYYGQQGFASKELAAEAARKRLRALGGTQHDTSSYNVYEHGGLIDFTGPAWVDGTKKKPEGILNAEQLDMLRNSVLTRKNPVAALLADYQGIVSDTAGSSAYNSINQNNGVNVERIELNMNVSKMSNDYDARRAADTMMDEVIRIARKSGATSVSRR